MKTLPLVATLLLAFSGGAVLAAAPIGQTGDNQMAPAGNETAPAMPATPRAQGERFAAIQQACGADFKALCPGMVPGDGKLGPCIRENRTKLSAACGDMLKSLYAGRGSNR